MNAQRTGTEGDREQSEAKQNDNNIASLNILHMAAVFVAPAGQNG